ncbi:hypothetical protein FRACYDRAFT_255337 [Fragilariopsis cylindrus CCMP1102]|uniref:Uncharacterized protein n=1 Tax=Fragilariopsis cylindrus CCMP1102 TaxID=635003 RepID=A0A1E7EK56_9STRA|nr:hypothetical protein FRACYDRAFT_255337 [Fragilariopsis cylindrus CCMP1102]|eukprot:OEU06295.1 hypothetical protein FRACYDRAFT_255337 [Fragilariopsis cylindrus CCMP1102]
MEDYPADLEYELRINHAGRGRVVDKGADSDDRPIPPSLWPSILEWAYEKSYDIYSEDHNYESSKKEEIDTTGPVLLGGTELFSGGGGAVVETDGKKKIAEAEKSKDTQSAGEEKSKET